MSSELDTGVGTGTEAEQPSHLSDHREGPRQRGGLWVRGWELRGRTGGGGQR